MSEKEYIERGALIEFVKQNTPNIDGDTTMQCVYRAMKAAPAAEVVEVVRCKDCRHYGFAKIAGESYMTCKNHFGLANPSPTEFCINGERKEQT